MGKFYKVKSGAIIKVVPEGSLKWYLAARYTNLGEVVRDDKTNTKKNAPK